MSAPVRKKYEGPSRRLLLAFDIGTTFSGISYSILDPGKVPEILPVTRFPSQENVGGDSKIATVLYYDSQGEPAAIGAEAMKEGIEADAEEYGWTKARWFKLLLCSKSNPTTGMARLACEDGGETLPPLPPNKTVVQVLSDYMAYLYQCAKSYIKETHGDALWSTLEGNIMYVLTHPNGWGGHQQAQMRRAAVLAGIVPDGEDGHSCVEFVTEGEASLHFCLSNGLTLDGSGMGTGVLIVDAGGGTIDITAYRKLPDQKYEEISVPACYFQGSAYVAIRAGKYFEATLSGTRFQQDVETLTSRFDRTTKHVFKDSKESYHIQFASHRERDPALNIRGGRLTVPGHEIAKFFQPSVDCIVKAIISQMNTSHHPISAVFLVGGFSASSWLYERIRDQIEPLGVPVRRPDTHVNKAVSNGAVSFYLDSFVTTRVARATYGIQVYIPYDATDPEHCARAHLARVHRTTGEYCLFDKFSPILLKNTKVRERTEFRRRFDHILHYLGQPLSRTTWRIRAYSGVSSNPTWIDDEPASYPVACIVEADISSVRPEWKVSSAGVHYQAITHDVVLLFGLTELKAEVAYFEDGVEKRGPAKVLYGPV
ncbi:hypothetical protein NMY22_g6269 [Coprinellus aureogranulatus]|nr:hypothetical protein NMY22_g6269 [Coprinellus aureogranulatus]